MLAICWPHLPKSGSGCGKSPGGVIASLSLHRCATVRSRGGHGSGVPESTQAGFCVFSDPEPESKFCEKLDPDPEPLLIFGSSRSLRGLCKCHFLSKISAEFRLHRWFQEFEQESGSQIKKKLGSGCKIFGTGAESENVALATSGVQPAEQVVVADNLWNASEILWSLQSKCLLPHWPYHREEMHVRKWWWVFL